MNTYRLARILVGTVLTMLLVVVPVRAQGADLLVTGFSTDATYRIDGSSGATLQEFGSGQLTGPAGVALDDGGRLYVADYWGERIVQFDAATGAFLDVFSVTPINGPWDVAFGPDGHLYVTVFNDGSILRLDGATGAQLAVLASGPELLNTRGLAFGPGGDLFVASSTFEPGVLRYDSQTGASLGTFVALTGAVTDLVFGPDGDLFVSEVEGEFGTGAVQRFDGQTAAPLDVLSAGSLLEVPTGLAFGDDGLLYVCDTENDTVVRFDVDASAFVDVFAQLPPGSTPGSMVFFSQAECFLVIGDDMGDDVFVGSDHLFGTHVGAVQESFAVLMDDIPQFALPGLGFAGTAGGVGIAKQIEASWPDEVPSWMADGRFTVQVLLWNPKVFPQDPEQFSYGLSVRVKPDGTVTTRPYGEGTGIQVWAETDVDENGQPIVRFPFSIPGL
jgi:DNA-binding beta-propeller fold protein YncE